MTYGVEVLGMSPSALQDARAAARACVTDRCIGKSLTLDLALRDGQIDPAYAVNRGPLLQWARAVWHCAVPLGWLHRTLRHANNSAKLASSPWAVVYGPAGALVATLQRIGWKALDAVVWSTPFGELDLRLHSPAFIGRLVDRGTWSWLCRGLAETEREPSLAAGIILKC